MLTEVSGVLTASVVRVVNDDGVVSTFVTSVNVCRTTWCSIPQDHHLHICRLFSLKHRFTRVSLHKLQLNEADDY
jgi:hypothetical protein